MSKSITILLIINVSLLLLWRLFTLSNDKIDLFLFYDLEQTPKWYAYYTSVYLRELITWVVVYLLSRGNEVIKTLSLFLIAMTIMRLIVYWLFRGSINLEVQVSCIVLFLITSVIKWRN